MTYRTYQSPWVRRSPYRPRNRIADPQLGDLFGDIGNAISAGWDGLREGFDQFSTGIGRMSGQLLAGMGGEALNALGRAGPLAQVTSIWGIPEMATLAYVGGTLLADPHALEIQALPPAQRQDLYDRGQLCVVPTRPMVPDDPNVIMQVWKRCSNTPPIRLCRRVLPGDEPRIKVNIMVHPHGVRSRPGLYLIPPVSAPERAVQSPFTSSWVPDRSLDPQTRAPYSSYPTKDVTAGLQTLFGGGSTWGGLSDVAEDFEQIGGLFTGGNKPKLTIPGWLAKYTVSGKLRNQQAAGGEYGRIYGNAPDEQLGNWNIKGRTNTVDPAHDHIHTAQLVEMIDFFGKLEQEWSKKKAEADECLRKFQEERAALLAAEVAQREAEERIAVAQARIDAIESGAAQAQLPPTQLTKAGMFGGFKFPDVEWLKKNWQYTAAGAVVFLGAVWFQRHRI